MAGLMVRIIHMKPEFRVFVFGLPRSGTSCMTHICELLGVNMIHTSEDNPYKYPHLGEYHPNPKGFYEVTKNVFQNYVKIYETPYSGCKMIVPVTGIRLDVVRSKPSKVIFMVRDPQEIKNSQEAFYSKESDLAYIKTALAQQHLWLKESKIPFLIVNHNALMTNTESVVRGVAEFIESDKLIDEAVRFVEPSLYRHKINA